MQLLALRIASVLVIAFLYMLFDLFNKRNVPGIFAYATLGYGAFLTLLYLNTNDIVVSSAIALVVMGVGYVIYRIGQIGAADVIEFAAISLMIPIQPSPLLASPVLLLGLPFIVSVIVAAGVTALVIVPLYYIPLAMRKLKRPISSAVDRKSTLKALMILIPYMAFTLFLLAETSIGAEGVAILMALMLGSSVTLLFETPITNSMVEFVPVDKCEEGDIVAFNLMSKKDVELVVVVTVNVTDAVLLTPA